MAAGVGRPDSVPPLLAEAGVVVRHSLPIRDHGSPTPALLARARDIGLPLVVTEKDAVGWAHRLAPPETLVISMDIDGIEVLCQRAFELLGDTANGGSPAFAFPEDSS